MKKKIAILTQPLGRNYGGIIQNYALQMVLKKMGFDPVTINRHKNREFSKLKIYLFNLKMKRLRLSKPLNDYPKFLTTTERIDIYQENFSFINQHLELTERLDSNSKFYRFFEKKQYDAFIVGSDQTWRPKYSPNIYQYFLDFLYEKNTAPRKIAYASSFGTSEWEFTEEQTITVKKLVKQFDAVSVREDSGVVLCKNYLDIEAEHVLDPTLLLAADDYRKLYDSKSLPKGSGIFSYILDNNAEKNAVIGKIADFYGEKVFNIFPQAAYDSKPIMFQTMRYSSPAVWLKSFDDADFVITDSFHGTVFAILYSKPFIVISNHKRGSVRFTSLLRPLELEHRLLQSSDEITLELLEEKIDFARVTTRLDILREQSLNFLRNALIL